MSTATFAETNGHDTAKSFITKEQSSQETVVLVVDDDRVDKRSLDYATNLCKNMKCSLTVLQIEDTGSKSASSGLKTQLSKLLDIPWDVIGAQGPIPEAVSRFLKQQGQVVSVILEGSRDTKRHTSTRNPWWKDLYCPVVIV
ncbi:MAG: hypothetical protein GWP10_01905 [Nitrospiraceae bacterium]|nr:hypothetical protein [Nitrospiraceae bacterium]